MSELVDDDQVAATALEQAKLIAGMPPLAAEQIKEVILAGMDASLDAALVMERKANALLFASRDPERRHAGISGKTSPRLPGQLDRRAGHSRSL